MIYEQKLPLEVILQLAKFSQIYGLLRLLLLWLPNSSHQNGTTDFRHLAGLFNNPWQPNGLISIFGIFVTYLWFPSLLVPNIPSLDGMLLDAKTFISI